MEDNDAIVRTALDYIEGWYQGNPARMDQALHARLVKRRIAPEGEVWEVSKEWMVDATGKGTGRIENPAAGRKEVTVLDSTTTMSSLKIVSEKYVDYLHLVKEAGRWVIVNALWDYVDR